VFFSRNKSDKKDKLSHHRVVTRYVGSGIEGVGSGIRRVGSEITALEPGIIDDGIGISSFFRDQG